MAKKTSKKKTPSDKARKALRAKELHDLLYQRLCKTWDSADACLELKELWELTR
jgi:hypothetical protein